MVFSRLLIALAVLFLATALESTRHMANAQYPCQGYSADSPIIGNAGGPTINISEDMQFADPVTQPTQNMSVDLAPDGLHGLCEPFHTGSDMHLASTPEYHAYGAVIESETLGVSTRGLADPFFDLDHNGIPDRHDPFVDLDHNGIPDRHDPFFDLDHNGIPDRHDPFVDLDHNGIPDRHDPLFDLDHNGIPDRHDPFVDLDHNGIPDRHDPLFDLDHNGIPDYLEGR